MSESTGLAQGALGSSESVVMGVAGTAPAFSVAVAAATLVGAVGELAAPSILYCGLIMLGVTLAFVHLNRASANAGASYAWVGAVFSPLLGFFAGWALLVASAVFMVSGTIPAATATLALVAPSHIDDPVWVTSLAAGWLCAVTAVIIKGIKPTSYTQVAMTGLEIVVLVVVIGCALFQAAGKPAPILAWPLFMPGAFTPGSFASGALTALFLFWGWDVTLNLNEETRDGERAAGRGALIAMGVAIVVFIAFVVAARALLSDAEIQSAGTNVVFVLATKVLPAPYSYLAVLAVMLSTVGTLETSILQFSRTLYAQARDGALHPRYARLHPRWQTPWVGTLIIAGLGLVLLVAARGFPSVDAIIKDSVNAIGFQICFYYSLTGFACAWHYRTARGAAALLTQVVWPAASAAFLVFIGLYSIQTFDMTAKIVGLGGVAVGIVPWAVNRQRRATPPLAGAP